VTAVWFRARAQFRERWRAWIALAVLIGVTVGVVIAAAAGARRTETAYARFEVAQNGLDFIVSPDEPKGIPFADKVRQLPEVAESTKVWLVPGHVIGPKGRATFPDIFPLVDPSNRFGVTINRWKMLSGRALNPARVDEAVVASQVAEKLHLQAGDRVRFDVLPEDAEGNIGDRPVLSLVLKVAGIEVSPAEVQVLSGQNIPALHLSPAFARQHPDLLPPLEQAIVLRTRPGVTQAALERSIRSRGYAELNVFFSGAGQASAIHRSSHFQSVALWLIAALTAVTAVGVFGQALARQTSWESTEDPILLALGLNRGQLLAAATIRATAIGIVAVVIGWVVGVALSPLTPTGVVRPLEPNPGVRFDWLVLGLGAAATVGVVLLLTLIPAWRAATLAARAQGNPSLPTESRTNRAGAALAGTGLPPTTVLGVRMAIEPGRGRTSVPIRTTILGTTFGIVALIASLTFSTSLDRLVATPSLYGWNWDALTGPQGEPGPDSIAKAQQTLEADRAIGDIALGAGLDLVVGRVRTFGLAFGAVSGSVGPSLVEGRAPVGADEIALGSATLRSEKGRIGSRVLVRALQGGPARPMRVVGRVAMPSFFFTSNQPSEGAVLALAGARAFVPPGAPIGDLFFVRFSPSISLRAGLAHLGDDLGFFVLARREAGDLADLRRVGKTPIVLAGILSAMAAATLLHTLLTSIRRRRRDMAILKTLGFVRGQLRTAVAWQAAALAFISLVIGIPVGVAAGRWAWRLFTDQLGVIPLPVLPLIALVLIGPAAILLAILASVLPGRLAARMRPAVVLRSE
jgi:FtsX-like permease family/MacB-like periplasmic core domain